MQRRGWLPLNTLIMGNDCLFLACQVGSSFGAGKIWMTFVCLVAALCLRAAFFRWRGAHGYWENQRKAQHLNGHVMVARGLWKFRLLAAFFIMSTHVMFALLVEAVPAEVIRGGTLCLALYLYCCRYLGPGDFAREKRESLSGALDSTG